MIKFQCPNGHPLSAPDTLANRPGKCPKCDASFIVPAPGDTALGPAGGTVDSSTAAASSGRLPVTPTATGDGALARGELFVFLCPNGHKLNGPLSMKGKAGQCPICGARFRIPTDEDIAAAEREAAAASDDEVPPGLPDDQEEGQVDLVLPSPPAGVSGLGYIVGRLWERRSDETELEVFLSEGEIIAPDFFSEGLSTSDYGVFAIHEGDDSFAVAVVPWSTVRRVSLRRMGQLPEDLFQ
jgi:hypothetical protein